MEPPTPRSGGTADRRRCGIILDSLPWIGRASGRPKACATSLVPFKQRQDIRVPVLLLWYNLDMAAITKSPKRGTFTLGRNRFAKISEIEGIKVSHQMHQELEDLHRAGHTAAERRRILASRYGTKA